MTTPTTDTTPPTARTHRQHESLNPVIHAALRRDLDRIDEGLADLALGAADRTDAILAAWDWFTLELHAHHRDEELFFWPAFEALGIPRPLMDALEGEHEQMVAALTAAEADMDGLRRTRTEADAANARRAVQHLRDVLVDHLAHEERELDAFSTEHHATKEVKAAARGVRKQHTEGAGSFFAWLGDTDDPEIARALRREVPAPVLFVMTRLGGRRYRRVAAAWS